MRMKFYKYPLPVLYEYLQSGSEGLDTTSAFERLKKFGHNELEEKKKIPLWILFLSQFKDFMILVLIAVVILSGLLGEFVEALIILLIIFLNASLGFAQEYRAGKAMDALKRMSQAQTQVHRDGQVKLVSSRELVPGDVVLLEAGNLIPADIRLLECYGFRVDESSLTGESMPVDKSNSVLSGDGIAPGDQVNMAFKGTLATNGRAKGMVVTTGMNTELGRIAGLLQEKEALTPLQQRMAQFGKNLSNIILLICLILFITGLLRGEEPFRILLLSVSLAVAAIPEALPALITVALSRGASRLAKKNALVRKLPAVETLGSVSYICSDKTGTLTQNKMRVVELHACQVPELESNWSLLQMGMALNHDIRFDDQKIPFGESTERALVEQVLSDQTFEALHELMEKYKRVAELPFDSDRRCMTTIHHLGSRFLVITKGASEAIASILEDEMEVEKLQTMAESWAIKGMRVIAFSYRIVEFLPQPFTYESVECKMHFAGLAGLIDPPREEVKGAIQECKAAGITPVMITGDHPLTAKAIAKEIGILDEKGLIITGAELEILDEQRFLGMVEETQVYARVSPEQKLRIVKTLQRSGHFVAMTGDGVNDAPSLRIANIGVAMGISGTDVSKEAAHLILLDDHFETIVKAVREGRRIFDNIRKFVKYIMTCNGAEIWTIFLAPLLGMPVPLLPIHLLWINLVTDGLPALSLASERAESDVMIRPPRKETESLFSEGVGYHILWVGLLMAGVTLGTQAWSVIHCPQHWQTMVFTVLSLSQLGHVLAVRSERSFLYRQGLFSNLPLISAVGFTFILQMAVIYIPNLNTLFKTHSLELEELLFCIAMSVIVFHAVELEKWIKLQIIQRRKNRVYN